MSPPTSQTHHSRVLRLQGYELPKRCHVGRLGGRGRRGGVKNVVVAGDEVGVGVIGHRELLHGTRLDQLLREGKEAGLMPAKKARRQHPAEAFTVHTNPGAGAALQVPLALGHPGRTPATAIAAGPSPTYMAGTLLQKGP